MRTLMKFGLMAFAIAAFALLGAPVMAYHDGGVAYCTGCHSMHSSPSADHLLIKSDDSSTCLSCHETTSATPSSYHISTAASKLAAATDIPTQRGPAGDFGWLRQTFTATTSFGSPVSNPGYQRGHNIIAADNQYTFVDGATAPGGTMPASQLACTSCHDPHSQARRLSTGAIVTPTPGTTFAPISESGSYGFVPADATEAAGVYRLLGGTSYQAFSGGPTFPGNPAAVVNSSYNRKEDVTQTRVAYGYGTTSGYSSWSHWCATCHPGMHTDTASNLVHVVDDQLNGQATIYNSYIKTGDLSGSSTTSFTSLVPFAMNTTDTATLAAKALINDSDLSGPAATDRILCLSCHRAHASGWHFGLRWNPDAEFLTFADGSGNPIYPGTDAGLGNQGQYNRGMTTAQMQAAYYDRPATKFAIFQRQMCNKCHAKD